MSDRSFCWVTETWNAACWRIAAFISPSPTVAVQGQNALSVIVSVAGVAVAGVTDG